MFAFPKGMSFKVTVLTFVLASLVLGISTEVQAKEFNCVVFADFQNPEDQSFLSSERVTSKTQCLKLAEEWTASRCFRYAGYGYLMTVIFDNVESLQKDEIHGPLLKQCPRSAQ